MQHRYATLPQTPDYVLSQDPLGQDTPPAAATGGDSPDSDSDGSDEKEPASTAAAADARTVSLAGLRNSGRNFVSLCS